MISDLSYSQQTLKVEFEINNSTADLTNDDPVSNLTNKRKPFFDKSKCLSLMMLLTFTLFLVEITVGNLSGSNSLVADSFHMLSDLISFGIAMIAIKLGKRKQSANNTFGWKRAEVLGGLVNSVFLLALCFSIIIEALNRFFEQEPLKHVDYVLIAGALGLLVNIIGLILFGIMGANHHHHHHHAHSLSKHKHEKNLYNDPKEDENNYNMNMRGVFLHVLADALGSVCVIVSAIIVKYVPPYEEPMPKWKVLIDPFLSLLLSVFITISTWPLLKQSSYVLLQQVPDSVNIEKIRNDIAIVEGVMDVHHFHVWSLNTECNMASIHLKVRNTGDNHNVFKKVKSILHENNLHSTTIQIENELLINEYDNCDKGACIKSQCCVVDSGENVVFSNEFL